MMMACAGPLVTRVHAADDFPLSLAELIIKNESPGLVDNCHYAFCNTYVSVNNVSKTGAILVRINDTYLDKVYCEYSNNIFILRSNDSFYFDIFVYYDSFGLKHYTRSVAAVQFDFNDNVVYALDSDLNYIRLSGYDSNITSCQFANFETNFEEYDPNANSLSLDVSFKPTLSGTISRKQTIDGKEYTSTTLDMYVTNNGNDAQFAMFIVPKGDNITFPNHLVADNQGFIGNPVFVYVSDEWSSFNVGLLGNSVYSPCSWHTVPKGFKNQLYSISWSQMLLQPNAEYDCVVYGCLNDTAVQTNTSSQWEMRPVYTVSSSLGEVKEVYRSTFSISDPAEFNPNYVDEAGTSHPWNPNADNSNLFNVASAYRDDNGNVVIKGQSANGGFDLISPDISSGSVNINNTFGNFFGFFTSIFGFLPSPWIGIITLGLSAIVIAAIIKKVTS